jgi:serine/threonine protein kinase/HEAT repeat protein
MAVPVHLAQLSSEQSQQLQAWVLDFADSWHEDRLLARMRELPPEHPLRRPALIEFIQIDLERRWRLGGRIRIEAYLDTYPELGTPDTVPLDLILAEYNARRLAGASADLAAFARRFPRQAAELRRCVDKRAAGTPPPAVKANVPALSLRGSLPDSEPKPRDLPEQFGRFRISRKLAEDSRGVSYLAQDDLQRKVVLKTAHLPPEPINAFIREGRAAVGLTHTNLCPVYDVSVIDRIPYVSRAYVEGWSLSELIQPSKPLLQRPVAALVRKLAHALEKAHQHGLLHRNLKPSNVMVSSRLEPIVMDFDLGGWLDSSKERHPSGRSPHGLMAYRSPEQVRGDEVDSRSDVYSLGVLLYELLAGQLPFQGAGEVVGEQILTQEPQLPSSYRPDLEPTLEGICLKAMAKQPAERYRSMSDFAAALAYYLEGSEGPRSSDFATPSAAPNASAGARSEGLPDPLLAELVGRLESLSTTPSGQPRFKKPRPETPSWIPLTALAGIILTASTLFYLIYRHLTSKTPETKTEVVVVLSGLPESNGPALTFVLDGEVLTREQLSNPITLAVGDHELLARHGHEVIETRRFRLTALEDEKTVSLLPADDPGANRSKDADPAGAKPSPAAMVLINNLTADDPDLRYKAATGLEKLNEKAAVPALIRRVADPLWTLGDEDNNRRYSSKAAALDALRALDPEKVPVALEQAALSTSWQVRRWACSELKYQRVPQAAARLAAMLQEDEHWEVREAAAAALVAARPPALKALVPAISDPHPNVRRKVANTLVELSDPSLPLEVVQQVADAAVPALIKRVADPVWAPEADGNIRPLSTKVAALEALKALARDKAIEALLAALRSSKSEVRIWACSELADPKDKSVSDALRKVAESDPSEKVREAALQALTKTK